MTQPPPAHHYHPMVRSVARALRQRCRVTPHSAVVVACSGGADSVALLRVLAMLAGRRKWGLRLIVGHVQHHLREEAEDDAAFVEQLAHALGLPYARLDIQPAELPGNLEANARRLRYAALREIAEEHDAHFIATAHHADDQLETLLMRMLRGSSVAGLRGIAWFKSLEKASDTHAGHTSGEKVSETCLPPFWAVIRPMLGVGRNDITALLDRLEQPFREDATNFDTDRTRARLRHEVMPVLKELQSDAPQKAGELVEHFGDLDALLQLSAASASAQLGWPEQSRSLSRFLFQLYNRAVQGELLRSVLIEAGASPGRVTRHALMPVIKAARDMTGGSRTFSFSNGVTLTVTRKALVIETADKDPR